MFQNILNQFVICFREGIEASLLVMTVFIAIKKRGDLRLKKAAMWGIAAAVLACVGGAYILGSVALVTQEGHLIELILYISAMITVSVMVFWMMKAGKNLRSNIEDKIASYQSRTGFLPMLGVFLFVFFIIAREGFETVLFLLSFGAGINGQRTREWKNSESGSKRMPDS